jgi:hypothetical protein
MKKTRTVTRRSRSTIVSLEIVVGTRSSGSSTDRTAGTRSPAPTGSPTCWLYAITRNAADYNGTILEKFDVVERSHRVFAGYGNVGTKFAYITREGFGWMNASYQLGLTLLPPKLQQRLERIVPPAWVFVH